MRPLLLLPALLVACASSAPGSSSRPMTVDELRPSFMTLPNEVLPAQSSAPLGETYTFGGKVQGWQSAKAIDVFRSANEGNPPQVGTLETDGTLNISAPLEAVTTQALQDVLGAPAGYCPVQTLQLSANPQVGLGQNHLALRVADLSQNLQAQNLGAQTLRAQTSPVTAFRPLWPDLSNWKATGLAVSAVLVYSPETVTLRGENRCINGVRYGPPTAIEFITQTHVQANIKLEKGWNALLQMNNTSRQGNVDLVKITWLALPAGALEHWVME